MSSSARIAVPARKLDVEWVRQQFPALHQAVNGQPAVFFDAPGGTQVPQRVIDAIAGYLSTSNANTGGAFVTSQRTDQMIADARAAMADFFNCASRRSGLRRQHDDADLRAEPRHRPRVEERRRVAGELPRPRRERLALGVPGGARGEGAHRRHQAGRLHP